MYHDKTELYRPLIYHFYILGMSAVEIFNHLKDSYGNKSPSYSFVAYWRRKFVTGKLDFIDEPREGRPTKHEAGKYNKKIMDIIEMDRQISVKELARILGFSDTKTRRILKKDLGLKKMMCKWVPHILTRDQKKERIKFCKYFLKKYHNKNQKNIYNIITGDETWLRFWDPKVGYNAKI